MVYRTHGVTAVKAPEQDRAQVGICATCGDCHSESRSKVRAGMLRAARAIPAHSLTTFVTDHPTHEPLAADWLAQANALCSASRYAEARAITASALDSDLAAPLEAQALNLLALCALGLEQADEAESHWRACIAAQPAFADAYSNLGTLLVALQRLDDAEALYRAWLSISPHNADALHACAQVLRERKQLPEAIALAWQAVAARPDDADLRFGLAMALHDDHRLDEAEQAYRAVLERRPDYPGVPYRLGNVLQELGRYPEAIGAYQQVLAVEPRDADALRQLGDTLRAAGRLPEAEKACAISLAIRPDDPETLNAFAAALYALERYAEAEAMCDRALAIRPRYPEACFNLGIILTAAGRREEAVAAYRRALLDRPDVVEIHNNLGCVLRDLERLDEAARVFRDALALRPGFARAAYNLGNVLKALARFDESEAAYRRAINAKSGYPEARFALATLLLSLGRFYEGWRLYDSRYEHPEFVHHATRELLRCAHWQGEPLTGRSILVWQEDGLGDMLHFGRYFAMLKARGAARIVFACMPALSRIFNGVDGLDEITDHQTALAQASTFDYWTSPMSLPLRLDTTIDLRARADYLHAEPALIDRWRARLADKPAGPTIGLVWKGNPRHHNDAHRSLPSLATLAPLWEVAGVRFVSLQKGAGEDEMSGGWVAVSATALPVSTHANEEAKTEAGTVTGAEGEANAEANVREQETVTSAATIRSAASLPILPLGGEVTDLADTAAIITQLDLVICVDTSVAHLSASLGKPTWILLPDRDVDWRWMHARDDSPWYPETVRLFRRGPAESWDEVVGRVRLAMAQRFSA